MTDAELQEWWPDLGIVVGELRRKGQVDVADMLVDAVCGGVTSSEILGNVGIVLRKHRAARSQLSDSAVAGWDAVIADVNRAYPGRRLAEWFARLIGR